VRINGITVFSIKAIGVAAALLGASAAPALAADAARGKALFQQRCAMCHGVGGAGGAIGPRLVGVVGRKAGMMKFNYSPAMKKLAPLWNQAALDSFLKAPTAAVPGTKMPIGVSNPKDRSDIIAHLATLK
jgi:cytochrome c2